MNGTLCSHERVQRVLCEVRDCPTKRETTVVAGGRVRHVCNAHAEVWKEKTR